MRLSAPMVRCISLALFYSMVHQREGSIPSIFIFSTFTSLGCFLFHQSLRLQHSKSLHPLEVSLSVIVSIEVTVGLLPWLVDHQVPGSGSSSGNSCGNDKIPLNLGHMHATHDWLSNLSNSRHCEVLCLL